MGLKKKTIKMVEGVLNDPSKHHLYTEAELLYMEKELKLMKEERSRRKAEKLRYRRNTQGFGE